MTRYNKLWVALAVGAAFVALKYFNVAPAGLDKLVVDVLGAAVTAIGVYAVPNKG